MTRNGPEIVILKHGSIFIASDVTYTVLVRSGFSTTQMTRKPYGRTLLSLHRNC